MEYIEIDVAGVHSTDPHVTALIDGDYDGEYLSQYKWKLSPNGYIINKGRLYAKSHGLKPDFMYYLHKIIQPSSRKDGLYTVFKNGNKLDCRSENLEVVPWSTVIAQRESGYEEGKYTRIVGYRKKLRDGGYIGVNKTTKVDGTRGGRLYYTTFKGKYIDAFHTAEEAAKCYDTLARAYYGDGAIVNFDKEGNRMEYKIEDDVPMPPLGNEWRKILEALNVGQSILVDEKDVAKFRSAIQSLRRLELDKDLRTRRFIVRRAEDNKFRIWRYE